LHGVDAEAGEADERGVGHAVERLARLPDLVRVRALVALFRRRLHYMFALTLLLGRHKA
jgi:hypothetical protein